MWKRMLPNCPLGGVQLAVPKTVYALQKNRYRCIPFCTYPYTTPTRSIFYKSPRPRNRRPFLHILFFDPFPNHSSFVMLNKSSSSQQCTDTTTSFLSLEVSFRAVLGRDFKFESPSRDLIHPSQDSTVVQFISREK